MNARKTRPLSRGEARIRRAFVASVIVIAVAAVAGLALYWLRHPPSGEKPVETAQVEAPSAPQAPPDQPPAVVFTDITQSAGIDFVHVNGAYGERLMPETIGSGAAFLDYDRDGDQDLLLINSTYWEGRQGDRPTPTQALYANDGQGRFSDVTPAAGLALSFYGMGVAVGDFDGDGWDDLYLTSLNANHLLRNLGGRFEDVTAEAGVAGDPDTWSTSAPDASSNAT
jgi:hypothetical protein